MFQVLFHFHILFHFYLQCSLSYSCLCSCLCSFSFPVSFFMFALTFHCHVHSHFHVVSHSRAHFHFRIKSAWNPIQSESPAILDTSSHDATKPHEVGMESHTSCGFVANMASCPAWPVIYFVWDFMPASCDFVPSVAGDSLCMGFSWRPHAASWLVWLVIHFCMAFHADLMRLRA